MSRHLNPKVYDDQNSIIIDKYTAGWKISIIAGYIGVSGPLVHNRLRILQRDGKLVRRSNSGN